jgi:hypothetical protein
VAVIGKRIIVIIHKMKMGEATNDSADELSPKSQNNNKIHYANDNKQSDDTKAHVKAGRITPPLNQKVNFD